MPALATDGVLRFVHPEAFLLLWLLLPLAAAFHLPGARGGATRGASVRPRSGRRRHRARARCSPS